MSFTTCGHRISSSGSFLYDETAEKSSQVSPPPCFPGAVLTGGKCCFTRFFPVRSYLVKTSLFANDSLASLLIAFCSLSFVIICHLWHFHKLTLFTISSSRKKDKYDCKEQFRQHIMTTAFKASETIQMFILIKWSLCLLRTHMTLCHIGSHVGLPVCLKNKNKIMKSNLVDQF